MTFALGARRNKRKGGTGGPMPAFDLAARTHKLYSLSLSLVMFVVSRRMLRNTAASCAHQLLLTNQHIISLAPIKLLAFWTCI